MPPTTLDAAPAPALPDACAPGVSPAARAALGIAADSSPALVALFRKSDLSLLYLNATGHKWLDPENRFDPTALLLTEVIGVASADLLKNKMLVQASVLGQWTGECMLRDVWGSEFPVMATLHAHAAEAGGHDAYLSLQATRMLNLWAADSPATSDHHLLHALLETLPDAVYFKDRQSRFIRVSRALARKDGVNNPYALIGLTDFDRFTPEHARPAYEAEQQIIRSGEPVLDLQEKETWPDGRVTWVSTSKFPLRDRDGAIVGTFGVSRDISARKQAEQEARELEVKLQLAQKLESIGRLAAGIAHEINTPTQFITDNTHFLTDSFKQLAAVLQSGRALADAAAAVPALAEAVRAANAATEAAELDYLLGEIPRTLEQSLEGLGRVARIVRSLKEFSHPNNSQRTSCDLNHVIDTAINVSRHEWKYVADVATDFSPALPPVPCIVDQFNQVILNLVINAAHAIESAAQAGGPARGTITLRTRPDGAHALVEVEDTGTGIPEAARSRIFEPFFTTKEIGKGTGQGLAIVHTVIVKNHQGSIDFTTEPGRGTTFRLRLPLHPPSAEQP